MQLNLSLTILEDLLLECDEAFKLVLVYTEGQEGVSVRPGGGTATITIVDDDGEYSNTIGTKLYSMLVSLLKCLLHCL